MNNSQAQPKATLQSIKLIDGTYTPTEAYDILSDMLTKKINFHNLQILRKYESNRTESCKQHEDRIETLKMEKSTLTELIQKVSSQGKRINAKASIQLEIVD